MIIIIPYIPYILQYRAMHSPSQFSLLMVICLYIRGPTCGIYKFFLWCTFVFFFAFRKYFPIKKRKIKHNGTIKGLIIFSSYKIPHIRFLILLAMSLLYEMTRYNPYICKYICTLQNIKRKIIKRDYLISGLYTACILYILL